MKLTLQQRIAKTHVRLMRSKAWCSIAPVALTGRVEINDFPSACTDGFNVEYGRKFCEDLPDDQLTALVLHENLHKALRHLRVWKHLAEQNADVAGAAMDFVINLMLLDASNDIPVGIRELVANKGGCLDEKYRGMNVKQVFDDLMKNGGSGGSGQPGSGSGRFDEHDWEGKPEEQDEKVQAQQAKIIEQALRQGQVLSRKLSGSTLRSVDDLLEPAVDYKQALRDFLTTRVKGGDFGTYSRPNRRFLQAGLYMPSKYTEAPQRMLFAVDTSGSIGDEEIRDALTEMVGCAKIMQPEEFHLLYWDTAVAAHEKYTRDDIEAVQHKTKPAGGGGTAPSCVTNYIQKHGLKFDVAVILTDGYVGSDWGGDWGCPTFWVIAANGCVPSHLPHVKLPKR